MVSVLIMMAGSGQRMNKDINKVLLKLNDEYIFLISANKFLSLDLEVILVVNQNDYELIKNICPNFKIVIGGKTRQESVYNALLVATKKYTLIHDAARPLISIEVIKDTLNALNDNIAVLVALDVTDTIKQRIEDKLVTLNRDSLIKAYTPQGALTSLLLSCHEKAITDNFNTTDDISLLEKYSNVEVKIIKSNSENFKITTPFDYQMAKILVGDKDV